MVADTVLVAGDVHGYVNHCRYLNDMANRAGTDTIVQCGDFGAWEHTADGREFLRDLSKDAVRKGVNWYWIDGNHDKISLTLKKHTERTAEGFVVCAPNVFYVPRGTVWEWGGARFLGFGGAYSVDKKWRLEMEAERRGRWQTRKALGSRERDTSAGYYWFPEEEASPEEFTRAVGDGSRVDVMITHDKPRASNPKWNRKDLPECWANQDKIQALVQVRRPRLLLHGHLHYPYQDEIRHAEGWTLVQGLHCDSYAGSGIGYNPVHSWTLLPLTTRGWVRRDDGTLAVFGS